jgi:hypothetical protein
MKNGRKLSKPKIYGGGMCESACTAAAVAACTHHGAAQETEQEARHQGHGRARAGRPEPELAGCWCHLFCNGFVCFGFFPPRIQLSLCFCPFFCDWLLRLLIKLQKSLAFQKKKAKIKTFI